MLPLESSASTIESGVLGFVEGVDLLIDAVLGHDQVVGADLDVLTREIGHRELERRSDWRRFWRSIAGTRAHDVLIRRYAQVDGAPTSVAYGVGWRIGHQIAILRVGGELVVDAREVFFPWRKEDAAASLVRQPFQLALALEGDARHAADADHIDRDPGTLDGGERLVERGVAVLVIAVADEDDRAAVLRSGQSLAELDEGVENGRAAGRFDVLDRVDDRAPIARGAGQRREPFGERRDDHGIPWPQESGEPRGRILHEVEAARHALAAVDEQRERRRDTLVADEIDCLRNAVFLDGEVGRGQATDEPAFAVVDACFQQNTRDFRDLGDLEACSTTRSRALWPPLSSTSTASSRRSNGFSSIHSTAYGGPSSSVLKSVPSTKKRTGLSVALGPLDLGDDPNGANASGPSQR